jgi:hypothetical protein
MNSSSPHFLKKKPFPWEIKKIEANRDLSQLSLMIDYVKDTNLFSFILPYAKSTGWWLPSHGSAYEDCGKVMAKGCDNVEKHPSEKAFVRYSKVNCRRKQCPICFEGWASFEAERSLVRLASFVKGGKEVHDLIKRVKGETKGLQPRFLHKRLVEELEEILKEGSRNRGHPWKPNTPYHVVLSPPTDSGFDKKSYPKLRSKGYEIARKSGLLGGEPIFHPYRLHCKVCDIAIPDYHESCPKCGGALFQWVKSPHFHVIGFGWVHGTKQLYEKSGWVVKNLKDRNSVFATLQYVLSHAGVFVDPDPKRYDERKFHVVTWFGALSYNKLVSPKIGHVYSFCPYCGAPLFPIFFVGGLDQPPPDFDEEHPEKNEFLDDKERWFRA